MQIAYREDKKFDDSWRDLCDWLDEGEIRLKAKGNGTKHDLDELQVLICFIISVIFIIIIIDCYNMNHIM